MTSYYLCISLSSQQSSRTNVPTQYCKLVYLIIVH